MFPQNKAIDPDRLTNRWSQPLGVVKSSLIL
jgi:hypothetical protein